MTSTQSPVKEGCPFCRIARGEIRPGKNNEEDLLYQDETLVAFNDANPASSTSHFLVIPISHLKNCWNLTIELLTKMEEVAKLVLKQRGLDQKPCLRFFSRPPFNSVGHVHLHVITLPLSMNLWNQLLRGYLFGPLFVTPEELRKRLEGRDDQTPPPQRTNPQFSVVNK